MGASRKMTVPGSRVCVAKTPRPLPGLFWMMYALGEPIQEKFCECHDGMSYGCGGQEVESLGLNDEASTGERQKTKGKKIEELSMVKYVV